MSEFSFLPCTHTTSIAIARRLSLSSLLLTLSFPFFAFFALFFSLSVTGMIAPTSGDALVYGASIRSSMSSVRKILGVCPQHNILFDLLTVKEHLELFAAIKDVPREQTKAVVEEMIAQVGLMEKINEKSAALSGGMQHKLSVGIALLGDSKIIFLDEPTSGMDPYSRRSTWELLKKKKGESSFLPHISVRPSYCIDTRVRACFSLLANADESFALLCFSSVCFQWTRPTSSATASQSWLKET